MKAEGPTAHDVVYGDLNGSLVFITRQRARELATIHEALWSSSTWGQVRERMPASAYQELVEISGATELPDFEEFYRGERESRPALTRDAARLEYLALSPDDRQPEPGDPFQAGDIGAISDGDWPGWTAQEMLAWVPNDIQKQYGSRGTSMITGECLMFRPEDERVLVTAFAAHGYRCVRNNALVRSASGYRA